MNAEEIAYLESRDPVEVKAEKIARLESRDPKDLIMERVTESFRTMIDS